MKPLLLLLLLTANALALTSEQLAHYVLKTAPKYSYPLSTDTNLLAIAEPWDYSAGNAACLGAWDTENLGVPGGVAVATNAVIRDRSSYANDATANGAPVHVLPDRTARRGDPDALAYIAAVEAVDGQALEPAVKTAINDFVVGCKADGIWDAIKASCILAGARTLSGALVPLKGTAPTNNNFVSGDYDRATGLKGNGSTKYLNSNRNNNADPQNSKHLSTYKSVAPSFTTSSYIASQITSPFNSSSRISDNSGGLLTSINSSSTFNTAFSFTQLGFLGVSRTSSVNLDFRANTTSTTSANSSTAAFDNPTFVFARSLNGVLSQTTDARLAFYSIGESLDLSKLDSRVSTLISDLAAAITP